MLTQKYMHVVPRSLVTGMSEPKSEILSADDILKSRWFI